MVQVKYNMWIMCILYELSWLSEMNNLIMVKYAGESHTIHTNVGQTHKTQHWSAKAFEAANELVSLHACDTSAAPYPSFTYPIEHTSHWILDPQDAPDKVRRLAEHPEALAVTLHFSHL